MVSKSDVFRKMPASMGSRPNMKFELRVSTMHDLVMDKPIMKLAIVASGTPAEILAYIDGRELIWKDSPTMMFGGYWYDREGFEAFLIV